MQTALQALLFAPIADDLAEVERRVQTTVRTRAPRIAEVAAYVLGSGGKNREAALELAQVAEYMHVATLIHDDIVDNAATRREPDGAFAGVGAADPVGGA